MTINKRFRTSLTTSLGLLLLAGCWQSGNAAESATKVPPAKQILATAKPSPQQAVLAGGCFWGVEMVFSHVDGVLKVVSGYAGGEASTASYSEVSTGRSGHAESVRITYDPAEVSYTDLLRIYFSVAHDPTQVNRQGPDIGPQYRSEIFATGADQVRLARAYIQQLEAAEVFGDPIATQVTRLEHFYPAEDYHQNYGRLHPNSLYIRFHDLPKLQALQQTFASVYKEVPAP